MRGPCRRQPRSNSRSGGTLNRHYTDYVYMADMLETPELICETGQVSQLEDLLPQLQEVPLYHDVMTQVAGRSNGSDTLANFRRLPLMAKPEMRNNFPKNFLPAGQTLDMLLERNLVELEHTSGTSSERLPVIFGRGWWNAQEERALRLNGFIAKILDEHPHDRRASIHVTYSNGLDALS